jgi:spermidine/putrescine-binding protein
MIRSKRFIASVIGIGVIVVTGCVAATGLASGTKAHDAGNLVIAGYGGLTAPLQQQYLYGPFAQQTGINVTVDIVPGQQVAGIEAQQAAHNVQWDLTLGLADTDMATLLSKGYLARFPDDLLSYIKQYIPAARSWGVPRTEGAVMISCNYKLVSKCPKTPAQFFDLKDFPGTRMLPSFQPLVAIALALESVGVKPQDVFPANKQQSRNNVARAIQILNGIKPSMGAFFSSSTQALQLLDSGTIGIGGLWNGTAQNAYKNPAANVALGATWDGAVTYGQWDVVYKDAPDLANAWKFIDWLYHNPQNLVEYDNAASSGTADPRVFSQLSPQVKQFVPSPTRTLPSVATSPVWFIRDPLLQAEITNFWTSFTTG